MRSTRSKSPVTMVVWSRRWPARSGGHTRASGRLRTDVVAVERAVDLLERSDQLLAAGRKTPGVDPAAPLIVLEANQFLEQLLAAGDQALPLADPRRRIVAARRKPDAGNRHDRGQRERDASRRAV